MCACVHVFTSCYPGVSSASGLLARKRFEQTVSLRPCMRCKRCLFECGVFPAKQSITWCWNQQGSCLSVADTSGGLLR